MECKLRAALLLGIFTNATNSPVNYFTFTENTKMFDQNLKGAIKKQLISHGPFTERSKIKILHFNDPTTYHFVNDYDQVAVMDLGPLDVPKGLEYSNIKIDNIVDSVVSAIRYFSTKHFDEIYIDGCEEPKIVGTAVALTLPSINVQSNSSTTSIKLFVDFNLRDEMEYNVGIFLGQGQRVAQQLMKSTSVLEFTKNTKSYLKEFDIKIVERDHLWMKENKMKSLLSTSKNSNEFPVILEIKFNISSKDIKKLMLVGKSTPYESSLFPLSDKPELRQFQHRSGMGGASSIVGSLYTLCKMQVQALVQIHCVIAIVSNQLHDKPNKKGFVVYAMNGTSVQIDSPGAEGRLIMADLLCYANTVHSTAIIDVTTLSSNIDSLLGNSYIGYFTSDGNLKKKLQEASFSCGEKIWQLPLYNYYQNLLKVSQVADISNVGVDAKSVTTCKSASFLQKFVNPTKAWIHLDISAVTECRGRKIYLEDWATGRSTRLLTEFCMKYFQD